MPDTRSPFRVLILNTPTLLGDLLADAMTHQTDFTVIKERDFTRAEYAAAAPEVVVVGRSVPYQEDAASVLLARWPQSLVVTIADGSRGAIVYELEPTKVPIGDLSPKELVQAIRSMIRRHKGFRARKPIATATRRRK